MPEEKKESFQNIKFLETLKDTSLKQLVESVRQLKFSLNEMNELLLNKRQAIIDAKAEEEARRTAEILRKQEDIIEEVRNKQREDAEVLVSVLPNEQPKEVPAKAVVQEPVATPVEVAPVLEPVAASVATTTTTTTTAPAPKVERPFVERNTQQRGFVQRDIGTRGDRPPRPEHRDNTDTSRGFVPRTVENAPAAIDKKPSGFPGKKNPKDNPYNQPAGKTSKKPVKGGRTVYGENDYDENGELIDRSGKLRRGSKQKQGYVRDIIKIEKAVITTENVSIKSLSEKIGKTATEIVKQLFMQGTMKTINDSITFEQAELVAMEYGIDLELKLDKTFEERLNDTMLTNTDDDKDLVLRAPVVVIMGHVDHGKTSLLDYIRNSNVAAGEAGGITQHIGAYTVNVDGTTVTFLDTPGHEAFTAMRARGAQVTDIAIIVVAVDDGVMPQTIEAINHARQAGVAIVIAINKCDKFGAQKDKLDSNVDRVKNELSNHGILFEEWGGQDICVPVSAKTGFGVPELLSNLVLLSEVLDLKANPKAMARGTVIESKLDKARGPLATVLVQNGTLRVQDYLVAGSITGRVKAMFDSKGRTVKEAGPSTPVSVLGFSDVPNAGDVVIANNDEKLVKQVATERRVKEKDQMSTSSGASSLEDIYAKISSGLIKDLNIILKTDVQGSVEAIKQELLKLSNEEVKVNVIHAGVGAVIESDIMLASTANAIVIGFNVRPDTKAKALAERSKIDVRSYRVIYDIKNDIELALKGMLAPKFEENVIGKAQVRDTFRITNVGTIAGCYVIEGKVARAAKLRLLRDNVIIHEGQVSSLKRLKDDVREVMRGYECGIGIDGYNDVKVGDEIEFFVVEEVKA